MLIYTVKEGDTLYTIAKRFDADSELIARDNMLSDPNRLSVGQTLVIRAPSRIHTVNEGENLYSIAQKYGVTTNHLWRNNPHLSGNTSLTAGDKIVIADAAPIYKRKIATSGYVYPSVNRETLMRTLPYLTYLTVFGCGVEEDGELGTLDDSEIVELARRYGVAPVMQVSNLTPDGKYSPELARTVLSQKDIQDRLIGEIVRAVSEKRYKGVELDFEYVPAECREGYAEFISRLNEKLGSGGYQLWSALSPQTKDGEAGELFEGHDYKKIGDVADRVLLQSYGWGNKYGQPMAIAPLHKVREVAEYANKNIAAEKIFVGAPSYAYNWKLPYSFGESVADGLGNAEAAELAYAKKAKIEYSDSSASPFFKYYEKEGEKNYEHEVWFEDARSVESLLSLVNEFGFYGIDVWNLMKYFPQLWLMLNGSYEIDKVMR